jgi:hypothetical protein
MLHQLVAPNGDTTQAKAATQPDRIFFIYIGLMIKTTARQDRSYFISSCHFQGSTHFGYQKRTVLIHLHLGQSVDAENGFRATIVRCVWSASGPTHFVRLVQNVLGISEMHHKQINFSHI